MDMRRFLALAGLLALAACSRGRADAPSGDEFLLADGADPALTAVLADPFLVDPNLVQQAHPNTIRPPEAPVQAQYPPGSTNDGVPATASPARALCGAEFERGAEWARRLPRELAAYPGGRLVEAAGTDSGGCRFRTITFRTDDEAERVLAHYRRLAEQGGYRFEQRPRGTDVMLAAVKPGTAFVLVVSPLERSTEAALVVDSGG